MRMDIHGQTGAVAGTGRRSLGDWAHPGLVLACVLVLLGFGSDKELLPMDSASHPASETTPSSARGESVEAETLLASHLSARRCGRMEPRRTPVFARATEKQHTSRSSSVSPFVAPLCELDHRNGIGAPLRC